MSETQTQFSDDNWSQLESALEAFGAAWEDAPTPPAVQDFLDTCAPQFRNQLVVELIKVDLEQRWQRGLRRLIEDYVSEIPGLDRYVTVQLIFEEYHARKQAGDDVSPTEYFQRFPEHSAALQRMFSVDPVLRSTMIVNAAGPQMLDLAPGETIDDFDLLVRLGQGAFATVFLARQRSMQRLVAVKISANHGTEPQTLAQLDHNNIVRVYDQRTLPERGMRLLYMQYAAGGTLAGVIESFRRRPRDQWHGREFVKAIDSVLEGRGEVTPSDSIVRRKLATMSWPHTVAWVGAQLARALDTAHRLGVLHRDLKPANVLLTAEGIPKLADFNISFSARVEGASPAAYFGGSLAYMSPEQLEVCDPEHPRRPDSLDGRSDLYSLGVLLWEFLSGQRPFDDETTCRGQKTLLAEMIERRRHGPDPAALAPGSATELHGLDHVIQRCIEPHLEARFATGLEVARELELCLDQDVRRLISGSETGWPRCTNRFPLTTVSLITVIPNLVAAVFNYIYNHGEIVARMPEAEPTFMRIQAIINMIAFPTGIACAGWLAGSVTKAVQADDRHAFPVAELQSRRQRCLHLGNLAATVGLTLWLIAAPAYPVALHLMLGNVPTAVYAHFLASLALCGLIAAAYPFFGVTFTALRCFYPKLLRWDSITPNDVVHLQQLSRQCWFYLGLAASVPMIAVVILVLSGSDRRFELVALAAGGVIGFGIALTAFRLIQADLTTLIRMLSRDD